MNTPAHVFMATAIWSKPEKPVLNTALIVGSIFPDAAIFWMFAWERWVNGLTPGQIFDERYFSAFWQGWFAVTNSVPLYLLLALLGYFLSKRWKCAWPLYGFAAAAVLHSLSDLPLHHDDGRPHFWPFSDWIYQSPLSYWDPHHHGNIVGPVEVLVTLVAFFYLWHRFKSACVRGFLVLFMALEAFMGIGAAFMFS